MELPAEVEDALLDRWPVARLATLGALVRPHLVPIVFVQHAGELWSPVDGKPKRGGELARVRNVRGEPFVSLLLDHYDADWQQLWWLRVDATAEVVDGRARETDARLSGVASALRGKYPQYGETGLFRGHPTLLRMTIEKTRSWCASEEAARAAIAEVAGSGR